MSYEANWYAALCRSRSRMGIAFPPFRWSYLREWWGWKAYVLTWCNPRYLWRRLKR